MTAYRYDPYLWVHLAGLATVPFWLILCLLGLSVDYPTRPALELSLVIGLGVLPVLYLQLRRPFCVFGLLLLALKPAVLTPEQRQLLTIFRSWRVRLIAPLVSLFLGWCLVQLYQVAPVATDFNFFSTWGRPAGLAIATAGLFGASLFLQVPASVLGVMATSASTMQATTAYPVDHISQHFCHLGIPVGQILPEIGLPEPILPGGTSATEPAGEASPAVSTSAQQQIAPESPLEEQTSGVQGI